MSNSDLVYKLTVYRKLLFGIFPLHMLKLRFINRERTEIIWKTDPSEIERTYNIRKQQTLFYWVCSWELMENATILTPPSTGLSSSLVSSRTQYTWRTRIWKNINTTAARWRCLDRCLMSDSQFLGVYVLQQSSFARLGSNFNDLNHQYK